MSYESLHSDIKGLIEINGPMGVNQLAKALNIPLSSMQHYMDKKQTYFKKNQARKRLTNPDYFLNRYKRILKPGGIIHLKTDNTFFYEYTMEVIKEKKLQLIFATNDLYKNCPPDREELTKIKTYYEGLFTAKGEDIKYCCFKLD